MKIPAALACLFAALLLGPAASAQELGRLFFTPEQRAALDARRKARVPDKPAAVPQAESPVTRIDGAVRRSGGKSTVWVNGEAVSEGAQADGAKVTARERGAARVTLPTGEGAQRDLRVGESLDRGSGEVRDVVGKDAVKVRPRATAPEK
jgi:hypothetical protein